MPEKVIIAMSGGVDSSVAAYLCCKAGFDCIGVTMKLFTNDALSLPREHSCCSLDDVEDARSVAEQLGMPYHVFNFADRFESCVINRFVHAYENGETPNPCIDCNRYLKFEKLYQRAQELGCTHVVTGHYARIERAENGRYLLKKGLDPTKDQSYVLYCLTQQQLAHTLLPLGGMEKTAVRALADENGFCNGQKPDSQDICFVQNGDYADFIEGYTKKHYPPGPFVRRDGTVVGEHRGIIRYTVGQRKGLGLALPKPLYVLSVRPQDNTVVLGEEHELYASTLCARDVNLISVPSLEKPMRVRAKVRYRQAEQDAVAFVDQDGILHVCFDKPQRAITCGQAVVLYDGDSVMGGGTIFSVGAAQSTF